MASMGKTVNTTYFAPVFTNRPETMNKLIKAISEVIHQRLKKDIAEMEPKNAMENLQRNLYNN